MADIKKPPDMISGNMIAVMYLFSALCMRFAWVVQPRNHLLLVCHASDEMVQLYRLSCWANGQGSCPKVCSVLLMMPESLTVSLFFCEDAAAGRKWNKRFKGM
ncbi:mitochondrial pyruvate carrier 1-like protein [Tanacetum coccineum]